MAVEIVVNQTGKSAGVAGRAREDLDTGVPVTLSLAGGPFASVLWSIGHRPIGIPAMMRATSLLTAPTASTTQLTPIDQAGTYLIRVAVDSGFGLGALPSDNASITFYAGALNSNVRLRRRRIPAFGEGLQHNVLDAIDPNGNPEGWSREMYRWFALLESIDKRGPFATGRVALTAGGAVLTRGYGVSSVFRVSTGIVDITLTPVASVSTYAVVYGLSLTAGACVTTLYATNGFRVSRQNTSFAVVDSDFSFAVFLNELP